MGIQYIRNTVYSNNLFEYFFTDGAFDFEFKYELQFRFEFGIIKSRNIKQKE